MKMTSMIMDIKMEAKMKTEVKSTMEMEIKNVNEDGIEYEYEN